MPLAEFVEDREIPETSSSEGADDRRSGRRSCQILRLQLTIYRQEGSAGAAGRGRRGLFRIGARPVPHPHRPVRLGERLKRRKLRATLGRSGIDPRGEIEKRERPDIHVGPAPLPPGAHSAAMSLSAYASAVISRGLSPTASRALSSFAAWSVRAMWRSSMAAARRMLAGLA